MNFDRNRRKSVLSILSNSIDSNRFLGKAFFLNQKTGGGMHIDEFHSHMNADDLKSYNIRNKITVQ